MRSTNLVLFEVHTTDARHIPSSSWRPWRLRHISPGFVAGAGEEISEIPKTCRDCTAFPAPRGAKDSPPGHCTGHWAGHEWMTWNWGIEVKLHVENSPEEYQGWSCWSWDILRYPEISWGCSWNLIQIFHVVPGSLIFWTVQALCAVPPDISRHSMRHSMMHPAHNPFKRLQRYRQKSGSMNIFRYSWDNLWGLRQGWQWTGKMTNPMLSAVHGKTSALTMYIHGNLSLLPPSEVWLYRVSSGLCRVCLGFL